MAISSGNVGIGTTNPGYNLEVSGSFNATSVYANGVLLSPGTGSNWTVFGSNIARTSGNVGIGITSPAYKLDVAGDVNITGSFRVNGSVLAAGIGGSGTANYIPLLATGTTLGNSAIYQQAAISASGPPFPATSFPSPAELASEQPRPARSISPPKLRTGDDHWRAMSG